MLNGNEFCIGNCKIRLMELRNSSTIRMYSGVKNLFNDMGPFIPVSGDPYEGGVAHFDIKWDGGIGRFVFLGAEYRFQ